MAIKTKDYRVDLSEFTSEGFIINAKKKTALRIDDISINDILENKLSFEIIDENLVVTNQTNNTKLLVQQYSKLQYIKTDYIKNGKKESYNLINIISEGLIYNTNVISTYNKKLITNGTKYNDVINFENSNYSPVGKNNIKNNKGLKIYGKSGNDEIIGTDYNDIIKGDDGNDTITGGVGADKITGGKGFNIIRYNKIEEIIDDKIYLTKGENLSIDISKIKNSEILYNIKGKDLIITVNKEGSSAEITIVNFGTKDITNNSNSKKQIADSSLVELITENDTIDLRKDAKVVSDFGTYHNDYINKNDYKIFKKNKKTKLNELITDTSRKGLSINGLGGNDTIIGSNYSDTIKAGTGLNIIEGKKGNDKLYGGNSTESQTTFSFNIDDDNDTIYSGSGNDILKINDIEISDLQFKQGTNKNNKDLIIQYSNKDSLTIKNYYNVDKYGNIISKNNDNSIKKILVDNSEFITGTPNTETIVGGNNNNIIYAYNGNDNIVSYSGDDTIYGHQGNDTIIAGKGNDYINGGEGNDNYIFSAGDGQDTIAPSDSYFDNDTVIFEENQNFIFKKASDNTDLVINYTDGDNITLKNYFENPLIYPLNIINGNENQNLENLLTNSQLIITGTNEAETITGLGDSIKNNVIYGYGGNDTIYGGQNNDTIIGSTGNDIINISNNDNYTLIFKSGDGNDTINFWNNYSLKDKEITLKFKDTNYTNFTYEKINNDIIIKYTNNDSVTLKNYFSFIEQMNYDNASQDSNFIITDINNSIFLSKIINFEISGHGIINGTLYNDRIIGSIADDTIAGSYGNDTITSNGGADYIYGGYGNDVIYGGDNNNFLYGEEGDDIIYVGTTDKSWVKGGSGNDTIYSGLGTEILGNGSQAILLSGEDGNDTYIIESDLTNFIEIEDSSGNNVIKITTKTKDDISIYSNKIFEFDGNNYIPVIDDLYLNTTDNFGKTTYGIKLAHFGSNISPENQTPPNIKIITKDSYYLDYSTVYTACEGIAKWLLQKGFNSPSSVLIAGEDSQKETLRNLYSNAWHIYYNEINGSEGNDTIIGTEFNDRIFAGKGNDIIDGQHGHNEYIFNSGDGNDIIQNANSDALYFANLNTDINSFFATYDENGDIVVSYGMNDSITFENCKTVEDMNAGFENIYCTNQENTGFDAIIINEAVASWFNNTNSLIEIAQNNNNYDITPQELIAAFWINC